MFSYNKASKVFVSHFFCFQGGPPQNEFGVALRPGVPSFAPSEPGARTSANWRIPSHRYRTDSSFLLFFCFGCLYLSACPPCIRLKTLKKGRLLAETPFHHFISNGAACLSTAHHHLLRGFEITTAQFVIVQAIRRDITAVHRLLVIPFLVLILYRMYNLTRCIVDRQTRTTGFRQVESNHCLTLKRVRYVLIQGKFA